MPTVVRQFPEQPRSGTQETPWAKLPASKTGLRLVGIAADAVLGDPSNAAD